MEYLVAIAVVAIFIAVIVVWSKKTNERQAERMKLLSEEQLAHIKEAGYSKYDGKDNLVSTVAVLTNIKPGESAKADIDFIFWNGWTERYEIGDNKLSREKIANDGIKVGDYITLVIKLKDGIIDGIKEII